jgi:GT2 family glycosyltransferase
VQIIKNFLESVRKSASVQLIRNIKNIGPVKARNIGAKEAIGDYLLFLDGDIVISETYITSLAGFLDSNPLVGAVAGKIIEAKTGDRMWYNFGYDPNFLREIPTKMIHFLALRCCKSQYAKKLIASGSLPFTLNLVDNIQRKVDWTAEGAFMTRRVLFEQQGGFDERFFMSYEGPDYCRRVRRAGHEVWYIPDSFAIHLGGHSHNPNMRRKIHSHSRILYSKKYFSGGYCGRFR